MTKPHVSPRWALTNEAGAPVFIQWKGTDVCMDVTCPKCGDRGHIDGYFVYAVECRGCGTLWKLGQAVSMEDFPRAEWGGCHPWPFGGEGGEHCDRPDALGDAEKEIARLRAALEAIIGEPWLSGGPDACTIASAALYPAAPAS